jgi:hypothetical protein
MSPPGARVVGATDRPGINRLITAVRGTRWMYVVAGYHVLALLLLQAGCARSGARDFGGFGETRTKTIVIRKKEYVVPETTELVIGSFLNAKEGLDFMSALREHGITYGVGYGAGGFSVSVRTSDLEYAMSLIQSIEVRRGK